MKQRILSLLLVLYFVGLLALLQWTGNHYSRPLGYTVGGLIVVSGAAVFGAGAETVVKGGLRGALCLSVIAIAAIIVTVLEAPPLDMREVLITSVEGLAAVVVLAGVSGAAAVYIKGKVLH